MLIRQKYNSFATSPIFPSWQPYLLATGNDPTPSPPPPSLNLALGEMWYLFGGKTLASARLLLSTATASAKRRRTVVRYSRHSFSMPAIWPGLEIAFSSLNRSLLSCYDTYSCFLSRNQFGAFTVRLSHYRCKPIAVLLNVFFLSFHSHFLFPPQSSSEHVGGRRADIVLKRPNQHLRAELQPKRQSRLWLMMLAKCGASAVAAAAASLAWRVAARVGWVVAGHGSTAIFRSGSSDAIDSKLINASLYSCWTFTQARRGVSSSVW